MKSFTHSYLERLPLTHDLVRMVRALGEFKGREALYRERMPQALETLRQVAVIQSTESSNRIEGVTAPSQRIQALVAEKTTPRNRSEREIAGYRDVLGTIHANHADIPFTAGVVLQFHRDLYAPTDTPGGRWKFSDTTITEACPDGTRRIRFETVQAFATPAAMETLHREFGIYWNEEQIDRLLLIPAYVLDFLCIHPFPDGNGRLARLLSLLLLYHAGYEVGRFISLERIIERSKETYYEALGLSSQGWHEGAHDIRPWVDYFLGVMIAAYKGLESRLESLTSPRGAKTQRCWGRYTGRSASSRHARSKSSVPTSASISFATFSSAKRLRAAWSGSASVPTRAGAALRAPRPEGPERLRQ